MYGELKPYFHFVPIKNDSSDLVKIYNLNKCEEIANNGKKYIKKISDNYKLIIKRFIELYPLLIQVVVKLHVIGYIQNVLKY